MLKQEGIIQEKLSAVLFWRTGNLAQHRFTISWDLKICKYWLLLIAIFSRSSVLKVSWFRHVGVNVNVLICLYCGLFGLLIKDSVSLVSVRIKRYYCVLSIEINHLIDFEISIYLYPLWIWEWKKGMNTGHSKVLVIVNVDGN